VLDSLCPPIRLSCPGLLPFKNVLFPFFYFFSYVVELLTGALGQNHESYVVYCHLSRWLIQRLLSPLSCHVHVWMCKCIFLHVRPLYMHRPFELAVFLCASLLGCVPISLCACRRSFCSCVCVCVCVCVCASLHAWVSLCLYMSWGVCVCFCARVWLRVGVSVCMRACFGVYAHIN
jgi:hypothetical protein